MMLLTAIERAVSAITETQDTDHVTIIEWNTKMMLESDDGSRMYRTNELPHLRAPSQEETRAIMENLDDFEAPEEMEEAIERHRERLDG
ncbi:MULTISPECIES: hypothetical protein [Halorussus]|uniref:hypothetical protein n=1 Tax=Halorussus TaxID=1070314 RepID=UPI000E21ABFC|nr:MULTISPECIES: hypothetical protein [Halorussus]NHN60034.1 hypothetical protein [Halorussus sp. JP-T4]